MIRCLLHGAGRMGQRLLAQLPEFQNYELAAVVTLPGSEHLAAVDCFGALAEVNSDVDLLIDFTLPGGTRSAADWCGRNGVALLSGTTALADDDLQALKDAASKVPVLWAPNLSFGVALLKTLVRQTAKSLGVDADVHVSETHHKHKIDAPSGTAVALAATVLEGRGEGQPTFSSVRKGEVIGEHTVSFSVPGEMIEITHKALDRDVFAKGALRAGEWLVSQPPGYYSSSDWLGLD